MVAIGDVLDGRFEVLHAAGAGGMGTVFRARDRTTGADIALKLIREADPRAVERFERESRVLQRLRHPNIVAHVAHGRSPEGLHYLAMEWLTGEDLETHLTTHTLSTDESVALAARIASALAVTHSAGIIHRDVKPSNVFLRDGDVTRAVLLDFGVAYTSAATRTITRADSAVGTIGYMAPEQCRASHEVTPAADVFALGCVLYECLAGRPAFGGYDPVAVLAKILFEDLVRVQELNPQVSESLDALVSRLLAKSPGERPTNGTEALAALEAVELDDRTPLDPTPGLRVSRGLTDAEQRILSVVVACLGGSDVADPGKTVESPRLDAEWQRVREVARRFGARVELLANGVAVVFLAGVGTPSERTVYAARCALALQEAVACPMALATGRASTTGRLPVGSVIDQAMSMLPRAGSTTHVRIDPRSSIQLEGRFLIRHENGVLSLVAEVETEAISSKTVLGRQSPFVGREREMAMLAAAWTTCVDEPSTQAIVITGEPGIGKSRLRAELERVVRSTHHASEVFGAAGDPFAQASALALLGQAVRRAAGLLAGEAPDAAWAKLLGRVARAVPTPELHETTAFLAEGAGVPVPEPFAATVRSARADSALLRDKVRGAFEVWLRHETSAHPVLLVLEDVQWGDHPSIDTVDWLLRRLDGAPLLVLALGRPETRERFPSLWKQRNTTELALAGLSRRASERLVRELLPSAERDAARVIERAEGNPFFLEELIRATASDPTAPLPDTVAGLVEARLDALAPKLRLVLRAASVFGDRFTRGGVAALIGSAWSLAQLDAHLAELEARELVSPLARSSYAGDVELEFRHALLREAAYSTLTPDDTTLAHRLAAEWLAANGSHAALVIAEHFERGGLPERAIPWLLTAATHALDSGDLDAANAHARRGLLAGAAGETRGALELVRAEAFGWKLQVAAAVASATEALAYCTEGSRAWFRAAWIATTLHARLGHTDVARAWLERIRIATPQDADAFAARLLAISGALSALGGSAGADVIDRTYADAERGLDEAARTRPDVRGPLFQAKGARARALGYFDEAITSLEQSRDARRETGDVRNGLYVRLMLATVYTNVGRYDDAHEILTETKSAGATKGFEAIEAHARFGLGTIHVRRGEHLLAREELEPALRVLLAVEDTVVAGAASCRLAEASRGLGELARAEQEASAAMQLLGTHAHALPDALAVMASVLQARGRLDEAVRFASEALERLQALTTTERDALLIVPRVAVEVFRAAGCHSDAERVLAAANTHLDDLVSRIASEDVRRTFVELVPDNRALRALRNRA